MSCTILESSAHAPLELTPSDELAVRWCSRMRAGDRQALASLYDCCCAVVEQEASRALGHRADLVADAVQDAWMRVARRPVQCSSLGELNAWLRRVAATAAIDLLRAELARRARERRVGGNRAQAAALVADADQLEAARTLLLQLPAPDRALLELRARTGATLAQLARVLGVGPAALDSKLRRAVERARRIAEEDQP